MFLVYALYHATYIINRLPTLVLHKKFPYEILYDKPPTYLYLKVFGCLAFASTLTDSRSKLDSRATKCIFLGYKLGIEGYIFLDMQTRNIFIFKNVIFYKSQFPYVTHSSHQEQRSIQDSMDSIFIFDIPHPHVSQHNNITNTQSDSALLDNNENLTGPTPI